MNQGPHASVWHTSLFSDDATAHLFTEDAFVQSFILFERALTHALGEQGVVDADLAWSAMAAIGDFEPDRAAVQAALQTDGVPVPELVRQLKAIAGEAAPAIHVGTTSQDLIDTATVLALKEADPVLSARLADVVGAIEDLSAGFGANAVMGRTRMQAALPIRVSDRLSSWLEPLRRCQKSQAAVRSDVQVLQFGGPVGVGARALGDKAEGVARSVARQVELDLPDRPWHTDRSRFIGYANWLTAITGALGKAGQDIALMAQQEIDEIELDAGGTSSAMPHKHNPVLAEKLVTVARYNAAQIGGLQQAMVHEQERSGAAWMLEWMILPPMVTATARALADARTLLGSVTRIGSPG